MYVMLLWDNGWWYRDKPWQGFRCPSCKCQKITWFFNFYKKQPKVYFWASENVLRKWNKNLKFAVDVVKISEMRHTKIQDAMFFGFRNINNQNSWFSVFVVIVVVILQIDLYCAAIPDQIIQVRVLKYDSLDSLPYGMWYTTPFFLGLRNFRKNFIFSIFVFLA